MTTTPNHVDANRMLQLVERSHHETFPIWVASREFKSVSDYEMRNCQIKAHAHQNIGGAYIGLYGPNWSWSLEDQNVIKNSYNDWYVFENEADARDWARVS